MVIQSVVRRQQAAVDFAGYYDNLCALQSSAPLPAVKAHLSEGVIDVNADRIRHNDWAPICSALQLNRSLDFVAFRSQYQQQQQQQQRATRKQPAVCSKEVSYRLCLSLRDCLAGSQALSCLEIEGIRLRERDVAALGRGLAANATLKNLSLESCRIGDVGAEHLCRALRHAGNVSYLNLSANGLTWRAIDELGKLIGFQATSRHNEAWRDSLRYRRPNFDSMHGLRRLSLNNNPLIDDQAAQVLADALKDDLWVKAIDLQCCGIGNAGAKSLLAVLKLNTTLVVLDLRLNHLIDKDLQRALTEQVIVNGDGKESEFKWLKAPEQTAPLMSANSAASAAAPFIAQSGSRSHRQGSSRRPAFRPAGIGRMRSRSAEPRGGESYYGGSEAYWPTAVARAGVSVGRGASGKRVGIPWRTAQRASRYKGYPSNHTPGRSQLEEKTSPLATPRTAKDLEQQRGRDAVEDDDFEDAEDDDDEDEEEVTVVSPLVKEMEEAPPAPRAVKALKIELANQRRRLRREAACRQRADEEARRLRAENAGLKRQLEQLQRAREGANLLQNEDLLESIEASFKRFHKFLDILRDAGLGRVVTAAGMDNLPSGLNLADRPTAQSAAPVLPQPARSAPVKQQQQQQKPSRNYKSASSSGRKAATSSQQQKPKQKQQQQQQQQPRYFESTGADSLQFDDANGDEMYVRAAKVKTEADRTFDQLRRNLQQPGGPADRDLMTGDQVLLDLGPSGQQPLLLSASSPPEAGTSAANIKDNKKDTRPMVPVASDFPDSDVEAEYAPRPPAAAAAAAASPPLVTPPPPPVLSPTAAGNDDADDDVEEDFEEVEDAGTGRGNGGYSYAESFDASTHTRSG